ncbi:hypothetical protein RHGRI_029317 [Rhododendron griersonianum]|uniref:Uncharacterized protein n=1 Tax=Rhododendron griersonianum TaxID=479676 RepID=A0AAV6IMA9_9ERIC|nr:hypothetical protein RHGRI_029317 [Rhododendron griersonianum]
MLGKCPLYRAGLSNLKEERAKKFEYCLPYFYQPLQYDELEQSTVVYILFPAEPAPLCRDFDWKFDEPEEFTDVLIKNNELSEDQKDAFKDFVKEKVREAKRANREARESRKKALEEMSEETKAAFQSIKFYKFYPGPTSDTPDVSNFKGDASTHGSHIGLAALYDFTREFTTENASERITKNRRPRMRFSCERSGKYRPFINKAKDKGGNVKENDKEPKAKKIACVTRTKKCECLFELRCVKGLEGWTVTVFNGNHNHPPAEKLEGHAYPGRLSSEQSTMLVDMCVSSLSKPREILSLIKGNDEFNSAVGLMLLEIKKLDDMVVEDKVECVCPIRRTHGLPRAHEIAPFKNRGEPIPLSLIDDHWKMLSLEKRKDDGAILKIMNVD